MATLVCYTEYTVCEVTRVKKQRISKKMNRFLAEKEVLLDCMDEYQEEIQALPRRKEDRAEQASVYNRIARRCTKESRALLSTLPWKAKEYRHLRMIEAAAAGLTALLVMGAGGGAYQAVKLSLWSIAALLGVTVVVLLRLASKIHGLLCDLLVWKILRREYQPEKTVWSEEQRMLLPKRLLPYVQAVRSSVEPENCIRSKLRCSCGATRFQVFRHPENGYLRANCASCGREIVLFDEHLDAHDADGAAQHYLLRELQMAACRSCGRGTQQVIITAVSDKDRSFFRAGGENTTEESAAEESGYGLIYQLYCTECGALCGDGTYFWSKDWEQEQKEDTP